MGRKPNGATEFGYIFGRQFADVRRRLIAKKAAFDADLPTLLGLYAGLRLGEVCALKWEDIVLKILQLKVKQRCAIKRIRNHLWICITMFG